MHIEDSQIKEFMIDAGIVSRKDFERVEKTAEKKHKSTTQILVSEGLLSEDDLRRVQAYVLGIPFVNLSGQKIDPAILSLIPEPVARTHSVVAFKRGPKTIEVAMLDTEDLNAIDFVKKKTGLKVLPRLTDTVSMKETLQQYQKSLHAEFGELIKKDATSLASISSSAELGESGEAVSEQDLKKMAEDLPVIRIVDTLLKHAVLQNASDIHIEAMENQVLVRYRIDGILRDAMVLPKHAEASITARIKVLSQLKIDEKRLPQDGRFKADLDGEKVSFRVSIMPEYYGEKTVMRLLRENAQGYTLEGLGFHGIALESIHAAMKETTGMILTTGPTGSGKTTTLYTVLDLLNTPEVNISTIEDPIEYQMKRINQTQVRPEIGFTFASGLRTLVRQDPDIIMVGEIRDNETAALAVNASLTGHLVLSTLHTNSAAGAVPRLIDMQVEPFLLVSTLNIVIAQRLVRRLTKDKEEYQLSKDELDAIAVHVDLDALLKQLKEEKVIEGKVDWKDIPFYRPKKSTESDDGYKGRMGVYEVLVVSNTIKELIMRGATADDIEAQGKKEGMMSMVSDGIFKAVQGHTTIEEVLRVIGE